MSEEITYTLAIFIVTAVLVYFWFHSKSPQNLPPGPRGLPFIGFLPFLGKLPHVTLMELSKKYGDMFTFYIGSDRVVTLSSFKLIKEVLQTQGDIFQDRPDSFRELVNIGPLQGLFGATGNRWIQIRRFVLTTLRNFGMGKASLEPKIQDEIYSLIEEMKKLKGQPTDFHTLLTMSITNVICTIMYGQRMDYNDKDFQDNLRLSKEYLASLGIDQWSVYLPQFLVKLFGFEHPIESMKRLHNKIAEQVQKYDQQSHQEKHDNFIEVFRTEAEKSTSNPEYFNEKELSKVLAELFIAGSDTSSTTLEWTLLYLIKYPEVQKKLQEEIDYVIGKDRTPSMTDLKMMPYAEATIMEVNRITTIVPLDDPHCAGKDTTVNGYLIPKGTHIYPNLWALHHNPEIFPEPYTFKPERFIDTDNKIKRIEELIPFSIGKRQCAGEALARMQLFLYLVTLLQHFNFTMDDEVNLETHYSLVLEPKHQKMRAILRD